MSFKNSGFKSSSFNSDFGQDYSTPMAHSVLINYQAFPKGPAKGSEMQDMYCVSKAIETYAEFMKQMLILQTHTIAYMASVDKKDYRAMASALTAVPNIAEIKSHLHIGKSSKQVTEFYISRMVIQK